MAIDQARRQAVHALESAQLRAAHHLCDEAARASLDADRPRAVADLPLGATAILFRKGTQAQLEPGPEVEVSLELMDEGYTNFDVGFTRGYVSSQAYADNFDNAPFQPENPTIDFDTRPFERQWRWLGFHARRLIFDFLGEAASDPALSLDVFAYDLDEPDFLRELTRLGLRLRLFLDNSKENVKSGAPELDARALLERSAGTANVRSASSVASPTTRC